MFWIKKSLLEPCVFDRYLNSKLQWDISLNLTKNNHFNPKELKKYQCPKMVSKRLYGQLFKELLARYKCNFDPKNVFWPKNFEKNRVSLVLSELKNYDFWEKRSIYIYYCNFLSGKNKNLEKHRDLNSVFRLEIYFFKKQQYTCSI